jgi:hypothetical protein
MVLTNKADEDNVFKIDNCRAKVRGAGNLVDCLASKQAGICKFSLSFGSGYFCKHPYRNKIIDDTEKLQNEPNSQSHTQVD